MRIVTFSTPQNTRNQANSMFGDEKISLRKLSQVKVLNNVQYYNQQQRPQTISNNNDNKLLQQKKLPRQSHIKWVNNSNKNTQQQQQSAIMSKTMPNSFYQPKSSISQTNNPNSKIKQVGKSPTSKRTGRRKIFNSQQRDQRNQLKQNISIPTFSRVPQINAQYYEPDQQQTKYYSMMMMANNNSPNNDKRYINNSSKLLLGSKVTDNNNSRQYSSPFATNMQNSNISNSNYHHIQNDRSSLIQLTQTHIPKLQQKLKQHDQQLTTIKNYLKNSQQLETLKSQIKQFQQIQSLTLKQQQIQCKRLLLLNQIQSAKLKQVELRKKNDQEVNNKIKHIEEERVKRLEKIKRENQELKHNLSQIDYLPSNSTIPDNNIHQFRNSRQQLQQEEYKFQGPVAFPSKDWESQQQIFQPVSKSFERSQYSRNNISYHKGYNTADIEISRVMKKKMNQLSSIGFSNNKTEQFSIEANTFRDFTSPLDFQGENQLW